MDAVAKMAALGVPQEALWEKLGASPTTIERWKAMQAAEARRLASAFDPFAPDEPPDGAVADAPAA